MQSLNIAIALIFGFASLGFGADLAPKSTLFIQKCNSGIDYPTKGDESVKVEYEGLTYHMKVLHPKVTEGPHYSTPFFWISKGNETVWGKDTLTLKTHIGGLYWLRIKGYFFAEKEGSLRGFFLQNGVDNAQNGMEGLIYVYDEKDKFKAWDWSYDIAPNESKGTYQITSADGLGNPAPPHFLKALAPLLDIAEKEADGWQVFKDDKSEDGTGQPS